MMEAYASTLRVIRVQSGVAGDWWCRPANAPAMPVQVVASRQLTGLHELVVEPAMSPGARYLVGQGDRARPPLASFTAPSVAAHRLDLWGLLPQYNRTADTSGDLRMFIACLQDVTDLLVARADSIAYEFDIERASATWLARILADLGNPFQFRLSVGDARKLAGLLVQIYQQKGTARGIQNALRLFLGLDAQIECHIITRDQGGIKLGGAADESPFSFSVVFAQPLSPQDQERVRSLIEYLKPAHTFLDEILFPAETDVTTRIEVPIKGRGVEV